MNNIKCKLTFFIIIFLCAQITIASEVSNWDFMLEGYAMASTIEGDSGVGRVVGADVEVDFDTILENLELSAMVHAEAFYQNKWGLIFDYGFMDLASDVSLPLGGVLDAEVHQGVLELFLARRWSLKDGHVDLYGGIRWWDNDIDIDINPAILPGSISIEIGEDWVDPVVGARWLRLLSEKWAVSVRGDIGGFGVASDSTWLVSAGAQYKINQSWKLDLKYKALWVDYEDGTPGQKGYFAYDTVTHGPIVGVIYNF